MILLIFLFIQENLLLLVWVSMTNICFLFFQKIRFVDFQMNSIFRKLFLRGKNDHSQNKTLMKINFKTVHLQFHIICSILLVLLFFHKKMFNWKHVLMTHLFALPYQLLFCIMYCCHSHHHYSRDRQLLEKSHIHPVPIF